MNNDCEREKTNMFPKIQEPIFKDNNYIDIAERYQYQYPIIMKYLKNKIDGWNIGDFLYEQGAQKIALYAITEFTELVAEDLEKCDKSIKIVAICDKNNQNHRNGFHQNEVIGIDKLVEEYESKKIDKILICSIFHANEIFYDLMERKIKLEDMITVSTAIFNGGGECKC
ncbi:hypothetical protein EDD76_107238 [Kineothrix alysoides]|uniref:Uncharacterized protein n=1 Tax=Kineothrix alysoides TaxID=1469948 RepID=A0A4R1QYS6_9FIRM|nr:hypothetical protein [Kineothrix alysoides]TCL58122.1 hypothetical protein EDD76_107238 [Kineothrix alysoides]